MLCEQSGHGPPHTSITTYHTKTARNNVDSTNIVKEGTATQSNHTTTSYLATDDDTANTMLQKQKEKKRRDIMYQL